MLVSSHSFITRTHLAVSTIALLIITHSNAVDSKNHLRRHSKRHVESGGKEFPTFSARNFRDMKKLEDWFNTLSSTEKVFNGADNVLEQLGQESCFWKTDLMCSVFEKMRKHETSCMGLASTQQHSLPALEEEAMTIAECVAIAMYSDKRFYEHFNSECRYENWNKYKKFGALLFSALVKLNAHRSPPCNAVLYGGSDQEFESPTSGRIYLKQFIHTSLDRRVAEKDFGKDTLVVIELPFPVAAAAYDGWPEVSGRSKILLSPFDAFEFVNKTDSVIYMRSVKHQDFNIHRDCDSIKSVSSRTVTYEPVLIFSFIFLMNFYLLIL